MARKRGMLERLVSEVKRTGWERCAEAGRNESLANGEVWYACRKRGIQNWTVACRQRPEHGAMQVYVLENCQQRRKTKEMNERRQWFGGYVGGGCCDNATRDGSRGATDEGEEKEQMR